MVEDAIGAGVAPQRPVPLLDAAGGANLTGSLAARLEEADQRLRAATDVADGCLWGDALAKRMDWRPAREWWYWRSPRAVNEDF